VGLLDEMVHVRAILSRSVIWHKCTAFERDMGKGRVWLYRSVTKMCTGVRRSNERRESLPVGGSIINVDRASDCWDPVKLTRMVRTRGKEEERKSGTALVERRAVSRRIEGDGMVLSLLVIFSVIFFLCL